MAELLGQRSSTAWAGRTGDRKLRAFPSRRQSLRAATGSLEQTCYHSCDTDSGHFQRWEVLQSELASHYILYTSDRHMLTEVSLAAYIFKRTRLRLRMSGQLFDEVSFNITTFVTD